jgi:hypothetical protein
MTFDDLELDLERCLSELPYGLTTPSKTSRGGKKGCAESRKQKGKNLSQGTQRRENWCACGVRGSMHRERQVKPEMGEEGKKMEGHI